MQPIESNHPSRETKGNYSEEFRRAIVARVMSGESASALSKETGIGQPTISRWAREYKISPGDTPSTVQNEVLQLKQKIRVQENYIQKLERALLNRVIGEDSVGP